MGFVAAVGFRGGADSGRLLESLVAIELARRGREFYTYKEPGGREVDFVVRDGGVTTDLIQVCYDMTDPKTRKRELTALLRAAEELACENLFVLTWEEEGDTVVQGKAVRLLPAWKWLTAPQRHNPTPASP
nr:DUF4143 domain-containing protein [Geobacter sp.]